MKHARVVVATLLGLLSIGDGVQAQEVRWFEETKLRGLGTQTYIDEFGTSVSLSGDTAMVGAPGYRSGGVVRIGAAYVFVRAGTGWSYSDTIDVGPLSTYDEFGRSVSLDGDSALIGICEDDDAGSDAGAVFVMKRSGTDWNQEAKLTASDAAPLDHFGFSVSLSGDTALVGAPESDAPGTDAGRAYVFVRTGTSWSQQAMLWASDAGSDDRFGTVVSLSGDVLLIGSPQDDAASTDSGSAYVFARSGTVWSQESKLEASNAAFEDHFGASLSLSGNLALVGAPFTDGTVTANSGSAYVFLRTGTVWSEEAGLTASDPLPEARFGDSVSLSGDRAVVGASQKDAPGTQFAGAAYTFVRSGAVWNQEAEITAHDAAAYDHFGASVCISDDRILIGAPHVHPYIYDMGVAYIFDWRVVLDSYCAGKTNSQGCVPYLSWSGVLPRVSSGQHFFVEGNDLLTSALAFFIYGSKKATIGYHGATLCVKAPFRRWYPAKLTQATGTAPCKGTLSKSFVTHIQNGNDPTLTAGRTVTIQLLYRDVADPAGFGDGLSNGMKFVIQP